MPFLFIRFVYPTHKIDEVVKKNLEIIPNYPPDPSRGETVVQAARGVEQGIESLTIFEVKQGKFDETMATWMKIAAEFRNIEGLEYSIEVWATNPEAMGSLGLTPP
ncbi:MAG: hypothetical protein KGD65_05900 [Candidatus Lokiarchaeota archaeon]|nr:hypothetical protein [Candidatus Lokiarchaeota archaeon]